MIKIGLKYSLITIAIAAIYVPLSAVAFVALALIEC